MSDPIPTRPDIYRGVKLYRPSPAGSGLMEIPFDARGVYDRGYVILAVRHTDLRFAQVRLGGFEQDGRTMIVSWDEPGDGTTWLTLGPCDGSQPAVLKVALREDGGAFGPDLRINYDPPRVGPVPTG